MTPYEQYNVFMKAVRCTGITIALILMYQEAHHIPFRAALFVGFCVALFLFAILQTLATD